MYQPFVNNVLHYFTQESFGADMFQLQFSIEDEEERTNCGLGLPSLKAPTIGVP